MEWGQFWNNPQDSLLTEPLYVPIFIFHVCTNGKTLAKLHRERNGGEKGVTGGAALWQGVPSPAQVRVRVALC